MTERTAIFVLGMHRSGTSALTRVLGLMGAALPAGLYPAGPGNPTGHWEPASAIALNDRALEQAGTSVNDISAPDDAWFQTAEAQAFIAPMADVLAREFGDASLLVFKDPRTTLLLPLWRAAASHLGIVSVCVIVARNPLEVAQSLAQRQEALAPGQVWPLERSALLWLRYNLAAERYSRDLPRAFCTYSELLEDWRQVVGRLGDSLRLSFPVSFADAAPHVTAFVSQNLRSHRIAEDLSARPAPWRNWIAPIYAELKHAVQSGDVEHAPFDAVANELAAFQSPQDNSPNMPNAGRPAKPVLRIMRSIQSQGTRRLCLVGNGFWNGKPAREVVDAILRQAAEAKVSVTIVAHADDAATQDAGFESFAAHEKHRTEIVHCDGPPILPEFLAPSIRLYRWLREENFEAILFQDQGGLGYASAVAKHTGQAFGSTTLGVLAGESAGWRRKQQQQFPLDLVTIGREHLERRAAELADAVLIARPEIGVWMDNEGWILGGNNLHISHGFDLSPILVASQSTSGEAEGGQAIDTTIVIPYFEQPRLLDQTLVALTRQTDRQFSVVIVDDGSSSPQACRYLVEVVDCYPALDITIVRQENRYLGAARNAGIRAAATSYVILLDDDNVPFPNLVESLREAVRASNADVVTCGLRLFHDENCSPAFATHPDGPEQFFSGGPLLLGAVHNCFGDATGIYRRSAIMELGGFHEIHGVSFEDWQLHLRMVAADYKLLSLPEPLVWYRVRERSMLRTTSHYTNARQIAAVVEKLPGWMLSPLSDYLIGSEMQHSRINAEVERLGGALRDRLLCTRAMLEASKEALRERLEAARAESENLRNVVAERERGAAEAAAYAASLSQALEQMRTESAAAAAYARSLEEAREKAEQYALTLERELKKLAEARQSGT
jgi:GT2 family glycosyltransferase